MEEKKSSNIPLYTGLAVGGGLAAFGIYKAVGSGDSKEKKSETAKTKGKRSAEYAAYELDKMISFQNTSCLIQMTPEIFPDQVKLCEEGDATACEIKKECDSLSGKKFEDRLMKLICNTSKWDVSKIHCPSEKYEIQYGNHKREETDKICYFEMGEPVCEMINGEEACSATMVNKKSYPDVCKTEVLKTMKSIDQIYDSIYK